MVGLGWYVGAGSPTAAADSKDSARAYQACLFNLRGIVQAIELYARDHKGQMPASLTNLVPDYLTELPVCDVAGTDTCSVGYAPAGSGFTICCAGHQHGNAGAAADQPAYVSGKGFLGPGTEDPPMTREQALAKCEGNLRNLGAALEMYMMDYEDRYPQSLRRLVPMYLRWIPTCPAAHDDTYSGTYLTSPGPAACTICCSGRHHPPLPADSPRYSSNRGLEK